MRSGRDDQRVITLAFGFGQQGDKGLLQTGGSSPGLEFGGATFRQHPARVHHHQMIKAFGFFHVSGGDQHAHAGPALTDVGDQFPELAAGQRINAGGGFVQNQHIGIVDQCAA